MSLDTVPLSEFTERPLEATKTYPRCDPNEAKPRNHLHLLMMTFGRPLQTVTTALSHLEVPQRHGNPSGSSPSPY